VTIQPADHGDTQSYEQTLSEVLENLAAVSEQVELPERVLCELVADRGYHSAAVLKRAKELGLRTYIAEPKRPRRRWRGRMAEKQATYANHRRMNGARGKKLARWRSEKVERSIAHGYETGGLRRVYLRGHRNILKRALIHVAGLNLGLVLRKRHGRGTPRGLQGRLRRLLALLLAPLRAYRPVAAFSIVQPWLTALTSPAGCRCRRGYFLAPNLAFTTGC
jgi:transposase